MDRVNTTTDYPVQEEPPMTMETPLSNADLCISRLVLPLITAIAANIFLPPLPATLITGFCLLSALSPMARKPRFVFFGAPRANPVHIFYRPWTQGWTFRAFSLNRGLNMEGASSRSPSSDFRRPFERTIPRPTPLNLPPQRVDARPIGTYQGVPAPSYAGEWHTRTPPIAAPRRREAAPVVSSRATAPTGSPLRSSGQERADDAPRTGPGSSENNSGWIRRT